MLRSLLFAALDIALTVIGLLLIVAGVYLGEPDGFQWSGFIAICLGITVIRAGLMVGARA